MGLIEKALFKAFIFDSIVGGIEGAFPVLLNPALHPFFIWFAKWLLMPGITATQEYISHDMIDRVMKTQNSKWTAIRAKAKQLDLEGVHNELPEDVREEARAALAGLRMRKY